VQGLFRVRLLRYFTLFLLLFAVPALADFTLVSEATVEGQRQVTTVSLRGAMLLVTVRTGSKELRLLRDTAARVNFISDDGGLARRVADVPDEPLVFGGEVLTVRFEPGAAKPRTVAGQACTEHGAVASASVSSFTGCYAPWSAVGLESAEAFARLMPSAKTLGAWPLLSQLTLTWTLLHPKFAGQFPGVPLRTARGAKPTTQVTELRAKALDTAAFTPPKTR
jgi:hypothetical protein